MLGRRNEGNAEEIGKEGVEGKRGEEGLEERSGLGIYGKEERRESRNEKEEMLEKEGDGEEE